MLRHGFAALVVLALVAPLVPATGGAMVCCRGGGEACACPIERGFSRCETPSISPPSPPAALLPPAPLVQGLAVSFEEVLAPREALRSLARRPLVPPPRS